MPLLSINFCLIILAIILIALAKNDKYIYNISQIISIIIAIITGIILINYQDLILNFEEFIPWLSLGNNNIISYHLGLDAYSIAFYGITGLLLPIIIILSRAYIHNNYKLFYICLFSIILSVMGVFCAQDSILMFLFWELELIPSYLLINNFYINSARESHRAANLFLYYTFGAGALLLTSIIILFNITGGHGFDFGIMHNILKDLFGDYQALNNIKYILIIIMSLLLISFGIKLPALALHKWLIEVHKNSQPSVSMIIAGILFLMGSYGLLRFGIYLLLPICKLFTGILAIWGAITIIYAAFICLKQKDMRLLLSYANISHLGFILLGLSSFHAAGLSGVIFQSIGHSLLSVALFFLIGLIAYNLNTYVFDNNLKGLALNSPLIFYIFMTFVMIGIGLPMTIGFVAESLVFLGDFASLTHNLNIEYISHILYMHGLNIPILIAYSFSILSIILVSIYFLNWLRLIFFGDNNINTNIINLNKSELISLILILILSIILGIMPYILSNLYILTFNKI